MVRFYLVYKKLSNCLVKRQCYSAVPPSKVKECPVLCILSHNWCLDILWIWTMWAGVSHSANVRFLNDRWWRTYVHMFICPPYIFFDDVHSHILPTFTSSCLFSYCWMNKVLYIYICVYIHGKYFFMYIGYNINKWFKDIFSLSVGQKIAF